MGTGDLSQFLIFPYENEQQNDSKLLTKLWSDHVSEAKTGRRLLALKEIFLRDTDENNQLSIKELVEKLKIEIPDCTADGKTIKRYIQTLRATDFDIIENIGKYGEYFIVIKRLFENYQLRLLIDPILSARFITE
ncbi:hypothetical protein AB3Z07_12875 [Metabacillus halosaccharovorans]|uniref:hypothetical protein n=1 Tax=Metabacillus halosaccharovorans TaxID=930124 RepID=UPI0034CFC90C